MILAWAEAHHGRTGSWPRVRSGEIRGQGGLTWRDVNAFLRNGERGLPGGDSLALLLARLCGQKKGRRPGLREKAILAWARDYYRKTGRWPTASSGPVASSPGDTWNAINLALSQGNRGLPGGTSLTRLLNRLRQGQNGRLRASSSRGAVRRGGT
jgi:hypothetical protein